MHNNIGTAGIFEVCTRTPAISERLARWLHKPRPEGTVLDQLGFETIATNKAVMVFSLPIINVKRMQHAIPIKWVIPPYGVLQGVFGIPDVDTR